MKEISYSRDLVIRNLDALPAGRGARYLECIEGLNGELVAKCWRRTKPRTFVVLICF